MPKIGATTPGFTTMEEMVFELEYTCVETGDRVKKEVIGLGMAQQMAKELAKASGRRAIIAKKKMQPLQQRWSVHLADTQNGMVECVWTGLSKREVMQRWRLWKERRTGCVLVAWPEWMPELKMSLESAA